MNPRIGTSGWEYKEWRDQFYPKDVPAKKHLEYFSGHFNTVELNGVFYRLPTTDAVKRWYTEVPKDFLFAAKASRFLTHMKKLKDPDDPLRRIFRWAKHLKEKLGPFLIQLPPRWSVNVERLEIFLQALPKKGYDFVIEFREPSWYRDDVFGLLEKYNVGLCLHDMAGSIPPERITSNVVYIRYHGVGAKYGGNYSDTELRPWADKIRRWANEGRDVYAYFNNDRGGHALRNAQTLITMVR